MLSELAKKNDKWVNMAFKICKDYDYAKDVVQEMYVRMYDSYLKNPNIITKDVYIWMVIANIIKDKNRVKAKLNTLSLDYTYNEYCENGIMVNTLKQFLEDDTKNEIDKFDDKDLMYLARAKEFRYLDRGLLVESYDKGLRQIEKEFGINYGYIHRTLTKVRKLILRDEIHLYKNKRLKCQKQKNK